jgi:hypothetical protein
VVHEKHGDRGEHGHLHRRIVSPTREMDDIRDQLKDEYAELFGRKGE